MNPAKPTNRPVEASRTALARCLRWIEECRELGWNESQMDEIENLWWKYHDVMEPKDTLERLVTRLQAIAKKNNDQFRYKIEIEPIRKGGPAFQYRFVCEETAEHHALLTGCGETLEEAVIDAANEVENACQEWDYELV